MLSCDRRTLRRIRLERRRVRRRLRRLRAVAVRHGPHVFRARADRRASRPGADVDLGGGILLRPAVAGELSQLWPEAQGLLPPRVRARRRPPARARRWAASSRPTRTPPDAAAELADAVTALRLATAGAIAAGPVVFERLDYPAASDRADPADRRDAAARRSRPPRRAARPPCRRPARAADARRRRSRARRGARSVGAVALLRRAVPLGAGAREPRLPARRGRVDLGVGDARRSPARRQDAGAQRPRRRRFAPSGSAGRRATRCGARSSRRCSTAAAPSSSTALDETLLGLRPRPSVGSARRVACARSCTDISARRRHRHVTPLRSARWSRPTRVLDRLDRLERLERARAPTGRAARRVPGARRRGRGAGRVPRATQRALEAVVETSKASGRNVLDRPELRATDGSRPPPSAPQRSPCERAGACRGDR